MNALRRFRARLHYRRGGTPLHAQTWFQVTDWAIATIVVGAGVLGVVTGFGVPGQ